MKQIPLIVYATMRRSGSHFCMHRTLGSVRINEGSFGAHVNSVGMKPFKKSRKPIDIARHLSEKKVNYFYLATEKTRPVYGEDAEAESLRESLYEWLSGSGKSPDLQFVAINIEDTPIDTTIDIVRWLFSPIPYFSAAVKDFPVFVTLRAIRSIALSRQKWLERNTKNARKAGFKNLNVDVWENHYQHTIEGKGKDGHPVVALNYKQGIETEGQDLLDVFRPNVSLDCFDQVPSWIRGYVMPDANGSSFVGSGIDKEKVVLKSIEDRASRLQEFEYLFKRSKLAKEHAERFGEA